MKTSHPVGTTNPGADALHEPGGRDARLWASGEVLPLNAIRWTPEAGRPYLEPALVQGPKAHSPSGAQAFHKQPHTLTAEHKLPQLDLVYVPNRIRPGLRFVAAIRFLTNRWLAWLLTFLCLTALIHSPGVAEDIQVSRPGLRAFEGLSVSANAEFAIRAVGPQDGLPGAGSEPMSGGEFLVAGNFVGIISTVSNPDLPRSTRFDGSTNAVVVFPASSRFDQSIPMTIEAWVFREDINRIETILSLDRDRSFWFGFWGPRLRFQRTPGQQAESDRGVSGLRWTQVAVAYDGVRASFFIDGDSAGSGSLSYGTAEADEPLRLGGDAAGLNFLGVLDEVRLWSGARRESEIRASMFQELGPAPGLVAVFPSGGAFEAIHGLPGQPGPGAAGEPWGILQRTLQIPRTIFEVTVDGEAHLDTEYAGAEQVVIRYDDGPDAIAYLVHRDNPGDRNLYVAITGLHDVPPGRERADSWVGVGLDPNGSRSDLATAFNPQFRQYLDGARGQMYLGDGLGGFTYVDLWPSSTGDWDVQCFSQVGDLSPPTVEFRIAKDTTGAWLWGEPNGLMLGHFDVAAPSDNYLAPNGTVWNSPATWPVVTYVGSSLVHGAAVIAGHVFDNDAAHPVSNHRVFLKIDSTGQLLETQTTDASGRYGFCAAVPTNQSLRLEIETCLNCLYLRSEVSTNDIQPIRAFPTLATWPAAKTGYNHYANVDFYLRQPIGPVVLTSYAPTSGVPRLILREEPLKMIPEDVATRVTIYGVNLHERIQVYLFGCDFLDPQTGPQPLLGCLPDRDYFEARIVDRGADGTWVQVEVPHVPRSRGNDQWSHQWSWVVKDNWDRPQRAGAVWTRSGGVWPDIFHLEVPYPLVFGFQFENEGFHARVKDYESTFGNNAYSSCVASDDHCYCLESSPGFLSLFRDLLADSGGSCVGVAATSLLLARMDLDVHDAGLNSDAGASGIQFPAGFTRQPVAVHSQHDCEPAQPVNLRAMIRANHGVQFSLEAIEALLVQMDDAPPSISADPLAVLNRVENQLDSFIICLIPELGRGHAVTPYAVARGARADGTPDPDANVIRVYDSNYPEDTTRVIEVFAADADYPHGWYRFEFSDADTWEGDGLFTMPISLFREERNPPDVLDAVGFLWTMVAGAADGLYRDGQGGEVGWRTDGSMVDQYPGARALVPLGAPGSGTRHVPFVFPATNPPPAVQINVRSNHFVFRAANAGRFLQLERYDGVPGGTDQVSLQMDNGRLAGLQFTPQYQASDVTVRGALPPEAGQRLVFDWSAGTVPAGQTAAFTLLSGSGGFEFRNDTGAAVRPTLTLRFTESGSTNLGTRWFGPFDVPADAVQQVFLEDGPMGSQLRSEIDVDRDGVPDQVQIASANPPPVLALQATLATNQVVLSWPRTTLDVGLEAATSLTHPVSWTAADEVPEATAETMRVTLPPGDQQTFFRLRY